MNDLIELRNDLEVLSVDNDFSIIDFESKKEQLKQISEKLKTIQISEENIAANKKLLAKVRKAVREIDNYRKNKKREALKPYNHLAEQIKELKEIIEEGDQALDIQIKEIEEKNREDKNRKLQIIFEKRAAHYRYVLNEDYEYFLEPGYLNKSNSISNVEALMNDWFQNTDQNLSYIYKVSIDKGMDYQENRLKYFTTWDQKLFNFLDELGALEENLDEKIEQVQTILHYETEKIENQQETQSISSEEINDRVEYVAIRVSKKDLMKLIVPLFEKYNIHYSILNFCH